MFQTQAADWRAFLPLLPGQDTRKSAAPSAKLLRQMDLGGAVNYDDPDGSGDSDGSGGHGDRAVDKVSKVSSVTAPARTALPNADLSARRLVGGGGGPSSGSHAGDAVTEDSGGFDSTPPPRSSRSMPSGTFPPGACACACGAARDDYVGVPACSYSYIPRLRREVMMIQNTVPPRAPKVASRPWGYRVLGALRV